MDGDIYDILVDEYGMTPEQVDELMGLGVLAGESEKMIPRQQRYAEELRKTQMPRGRRYGGVYKAAHPLEFLGSGLQQAAGHFGEWRADKRQEEILKQQADLRACYLRGDCGGGRPQTSGLPPAGAPATPMPYGSPAPVNPMEFGQLQPYLRR